MIKKTIILGVPIVCTLLTQCKSIDRDKNCDQQICTMEFRSINVVIKDAKGELYKADKVESYTKTGRLLHSQSGSSVYPEGQYVVLTDNNKKDLILNSNNDIDFKIYKGGSIQKTVRFIATADCCHISKVSGPDTLLID